MPSDTPFSELAQVNPPRPALDLRDLDPVSFIPMRNVSESGRWTEQQSRPYGEVRRGYTYCAEGDVLFAKITPCTENGKGCHAIGLTNGVGFASTEFHVLRAKEGVDPGYIFQWSVNLPLRLNAAAHMTGSAGQQRVPAAFFSRFTVPKLPLPEQSKIAEVLSTVDRAIEQTEALIAKQQRIKTGLMQDLLTRGIDEHGNLRSEQTHEFKDSPLGRIPVEWECASFGDCWGASPQNGLYKPQSQYSDDGTPIVRIDGFRNGDLIDHQTFRRVGLAPAESRTFALEAGDLLVNRVNSIEWLGKAALVGSLTETTVFESNMMRIRVDQKWLISEFAILLLSSPHAYHHFRLCAKTAIAQASINQEDARSLLVALPHRVEQQRIVDAVQAAHRADGRLKAATLKLRLLRTGLMQDLLTGNRRVTPLLEQCEGATT